MAKPPPSPRASGDDKAKAPSPGPTVAKAAAAAASKIDDAHAQASRATAGAAIGSGSGAANTSTLNSQITDAAATVDLLTTGFGPSQSMAILDVTLAQTLGLAMQNAVLRQQADRVVSQALISAACARILHHAIPPFELLVPPPPSAPTPARAKATS